ncbi:PadR family transcriptional regulator [Rhodococcus maanshanensis]|uniref:Transcriptional regulator PadR-like family protein n=1 Tax=Rhodococcus maanshanensis TaxID=183556 RepID=A0A1H7TUQ0_9NOCA|nr:PadR family transcriptional regulator [Rhodococcus maanshanensis]SEL88285.1 Transcriptional regulator PadR-like family protein [Rhodococcus maanshanensis]
MPAELTESEVTLLGLIAERPRHGFDLEKVIGERGMRQWTQIGFSSIYYLLGKLEKRGLIEEVAAPSGGPGRARRVYAITPEGRAAAAERTAAFLAEPSAVAAPVLVGMANWPLLPPAESIGALRRRSDALGRKRAEVLAARDAQQPLPDFVDAVFEYSLAMLEAEQNWVARTLTTLERKR